MAGPREAKTVPRYPEPVFLFLCTDGPEGARLRDLHLEGHCAHVEAHVGRYVVAGPLRRPGEAAISGSLFLVAAAHEAEARALMAGDPYFTSPLYADVQVFALTPGAGRLLGNGVIWDEIASLRAIASGTAANEQGRV